MGGFAHSGGPDDQFTPQQQHLFTHESLQRVATGRRCLSVSFPGILIVDDMGDVFFTFSKHLMQVQGLKVSRLSYESLQDCLCVFVADVLS